MSKDISSSMSHFGRGFDHYNRNLPRNGLKEKILKRCLLKESLILQCFYILHAISLGNLCKVNSSMSRLSCSL